MAADVKRSIEDIKAEVPLCDDSDDKGDYDDDGSGPVSDGHKTCYCCRSAAATGIVFINNIYKWQHSIF